MEEFIDEIYSNPIVTFGIAVAVASLVVFSKRVALYKSKGVFLAACFIFLGTLMMYEENNEIAFMSAAFVISLVQDSSTI